MGVRSQAAEDSAGRSARPTWLAWIASQGEAGARFAATDWARTELGPVEQWPAPLRTAVMICLGSPVAMSVRLGDQLPLVHNDACLDVLSPGLLGCAFGAPGSDGELAELMTTDQPLPVTDRLVSPGAPVRGEQRWVSRSRFPLVGDDGMAMGVLSVFLATPDEIRTPGDAQTEWSFGVFDAMEEAVLVTDDRGVVLQVNHSFTELFGYSMSDGPLRPPYPWFPTEQEDPEGHARNRELIPSSLATMSGEEELLLYSRDRRPVWVTWTVSRAARPGAGGVRLLHIVRDITKERDARQRRAWAAKISADLSSADELDTVLAVAEHGFGVLFDGGSTIQVSLGDDMPVLLYGGAVSTPDDLPGAIRTGLAGSRNPDALHPRPGILLVPASTNSNCRVWVQFPQPRRIAADEMIVADLLAQAFALAVDRVVTARLAGHREANLRQALDSHRVIGQAVGILVERHRMSTIAAFERLKRTSQNRNIKLREVARQVLEQGVDPEDI